MHEHHQAQQYDRDVHVLLRLNRESLRWQQAFAGENRDRHQLKWLNLDPQLALRFEVVYRENQLIGIPRMGKQLLVLLVMFRFLKNLMSLVNL